METKKKEFKSLSECIKTIGIELDQWELKIKQDEVYKRQSEEHIVQERERLELMRSMVMYVLREVDKFTSVEAFVYDMGKMLIEDGNVPDSVKEVPLGMFYEQIREGFEKSYTLVEKYRKNDRMYFTEWFEKHNKTKKKRSDNANAKNTGQGG